ncbi:MAG TPA: 7-cyano-7-deazaguanine synthase QueC [Candidatus Polarisedimenticolaceae bacterium]|nr:7-cyano-7-deazaguanine synthase QueC [Candidatus Polarisedimenticolaceae bacterium]
MERAVVLLSGGLDSATCLAWAVAQPFEVHALTVAYGQRHAIEVERAAQIARRLGAASHRVVPLDLSFLSGSALTDRSVDVPKGRSAEAIATGIPSTYVPARNTVFLSLALAWAEVLEARDLVLGVNAVDYSGYPDCRPAFLRAFEAMAAVGTKAGVSGAPVRIHAPLLEASKAEIVRRAAAWNVPLDLTISCYDPGPDGRPCRSCDACALRARGFYEAGLSDPADSL